MKKPLYTLVFVLALSLAYATAQTSPATPSGDQTTPQSQTAPQTSPSSSAPVTGQTAPTSQSSGSMPSSAVSAGGDVQTQIQNALKSDPTLASDSITVAVTDTEVELSGNVMSSKEKQTAKRIAKSYAGSRKVKDSLTMAHSQDNTNTNPAGNAGESTGTSTPSTPSTPPSSARPPKQ